MGNKVGGERKTVLEDLRKSRQELGESVTVQKVRRLRQIVERIDADIGDKSLKIKRGSLTSEDLLGELTAAKQDVSRAEKIFADEEDRQREKWAEERRKEKERAAAEKELEYIKLGAAAAYEKDRYQLERWRDNADIRDDQAAVEDFSARLAKLERGGVQPYIEERIQWAQEKRENERREKEKQERLSALPNPVPLLYTWLTGEESDMARRNAWEAATLAGGKVDNSGKDLTAINQNVDKLLYDDNSIYYTKDIGRAVRQKIAEVVKTASDAGYNVDNDGVQLALMRLAIRVGSDKSETTVGAHTHLSEAGGGQYGYDDYKNQQIKH